MFAALEEKSTKNVSKINPRSGERSNPISGGIIPRKIRKYGSVIFPSEENGCV